MNECVETIKKLNELKLYYIPAEEKQENINYKKLTFLKSH